MSLQTETQLTVSLSAGGASQGEDAHPRERRGQATDVAGVTRGNDRSIKLEGGCDNEGINRVGRREPQSGEHVSGLLSGSSDTRMPGLLSQWLIAASYLTPRQTWGRNPDKSAFLIGETKYRRGARG